MSETDFYIRTISYKSEYYMSITDVLDWLDTLTGTKGQELARDFIGLRLAGMFFYDHNDNVP